MDQLCSRVLPHNCLIGSFFSPPTVDAYQNAAMGSTMELSNSAGSPPPALLQTMFSHTRMAMIATDPRQDDNPIVYANPAFLEMTGYEIDEVVGRNCRFLQGPDTDPDTIAKVRRIIADEDYGVVEILNYKKNGEAFWNALHISPVYDASGQLTHFFGSQWDVSDQRAAIDAIKGNARLNDGRMQEAIDRTREMEMAINQARDSVLMTEYAPLAEPGPRITWVSEGFERMTGYSADEVIGRSPRFLQGEKTDRAALGALRESLEAGKPHEHVRTINYRKDGTPFAIEWSVSPITDQTGRPYAWLAVQRDVTQQVEAEEERERLIDELDHRVRNLFATVQVIARGADDADGTADALRRRLVYQLEALNAAHDLVFRDASQVAPLGDIVTAILAPFDPDAVLIERRGGEGNVESKQAISAALVLYELALLSSERGAIASKKPVSVSWKKVGAELRITWREEAGIPEDGRFGFGLVKTFVKASKWKKAGVSEEEGGFAVRLGLRAS